jgi:SAM-dependent methyltransferase
MLCNKVIIKPGNTQAKQGMSDADRIRWNQRYLDSSNRPLRPASDFLQKHIHAAPRGSALDLACGSGRNALYMARQGFVVDAIDISDVGLARAQQQAALEHLQVTWFCQDLLDSPLLPNAPYQLIILFRFVAPELLQQLPQHLAPGGMLLVEEHMHIPVEAQHLDISGPGSNRFRVAPGALAAALAGLELGVCEEGLVSEPDDSLAALARVQAFKPR